MAEKKVKVSISPMKLIIFLIIGAALVALFFMKKDDGETDFDQVIDDEKEVILPRETGVADSGFEKKNASFTLLNAQADYDNLEEIDGAQSLKISFSDRPTSSVKIGDYFNDIEEGKFYRLSFWSRNGSEKEKKVAVNLSGDGRAQRLGDFDLQGNGNVRHYEFNFQAENPARDLVLTATDGVEDYVLADNFRVESLDIDSADQLKDIQPTVFGDTSWKNVDEIQTRGDEDSEELLLESVIKIGQVFRPAEPLLSGVAFKIQKVGIGGTGVYKLQLREYDQTLGIISDNILSSKNINISYPPSVSEEMKEREKQMRDDLAQKEKDIKEGIIPNDRTTEEYPENYTDKQIDAEKAKKRKADLELAIKDMKESYNIPEEIEVPISAKLDTGKKYWIGIDNSGVKVNEDNYIKIFYNSHAGPEIEPSFISDAANTWKEYHPLWIKAFYSRHNEKEGKKIMSGSTLSDFGNGRMVYRYQFSGHDGSFASGFPGKKILDMYDGNLTSSDASGNYLLSGPDQYAIYKFDTFNPVRKIILRDILYHQSLGIDFSTDGENWKEAIWENPAENSQKINPLTVSAEGENTGFYLRVKPAGEQCTLINFSLEAEIEGCGSSGCSAASEPEISSEPEPQEEAVSQMIKVAVYNGSETKGLAAAIADRISGIAAVEVSEKSNAQGNYDRNMVIDLTGNNGSKAEEIAAGLNGEIGSLPDGEAKPDADILIIGAAL